MPGTPNVGPGHVALMGALPVDLELRQPVRADHREAQVGRLTQQRALGGPRVAPERRLLDPVHAERVLRARG